MTTLAPRAGSVSEARVPAAEHDRKRCARRVLESLLLLPRNICVAILDVYRAVISPLYGQVCRYYPSCSRYTLTAIQEHGVIRGVWLGGRRLLRCHPWAAGGIDDVPVHPRTHAVFARGGFVIRRDTHSDCDHSHPDPDALLSEGDSPRA